MNNPTKGIDMSDLNLRRSSTDKVVAGVCGGLARQFGIDANLIRVVFVLLLFTQIGWVLYLALWLFLPSDNGPSGLESLKRQFSNNGGSN